MNKKQRFFGMGLGAIVLRIGFYGSLLSLILLLVPDWQQHFYPVSSISVGIMFSGFFIYAYFRGDPTKKAGYFGKWWHILVPWK